MAGVSDPALRLQCKKMGAGLVVTEFTSIHSIVAKEKQLKEHMKSITEFIEYSEQERPLSVQLFGSDLDALEKAAKIVEPYFDIIDYNMGCPAPHITQQMAGGALLQQSNLTEQIFKTLVNAVKKPVTLKIRSGVTEASRYLFKDIAEIAEDEGIEMIIVGPEDPLVNGVYDFFNNEPDLQHISVIGPSKKGAQLEGSKNFAKEFMARNNIPTAKYKTFTKKNIEDGFVFLETLEPPFVLKADGLAVKPQTYLKYLHLDFLIL